MLHYNHFNYWPKFIFNANFYVCIHKIKTTPEKCLSTTLHLIDVIDLSLETNNFDCATEYQVLLTSLVLSLMKFGYDPRNGLNAILQTIQQTNGQSIDVDEVFDYILITMSQILHNITPFYLGSALEVIKVNFHKNSIFFIFCIKNRPFYRF